MKDDNVSKTEYPVVPDVPKKTAAAKKKLDSVSKCVEEMCAVTGGAALYVKTEKDAQRAKELLSKKRPDQISQVKVNEKQKVDALWVML